MAEAPIKYGTNKSDLTKILNSAITKWDGFIYQGLCAICVVLQQITEDMECAKSRYINLEGYDDFAVLDENKNILSFHQAKCYKPLKPNFEEDMALMEDKRQYWHEKGMCTSNAGLYFHCNREICCHHNVSQYRYSNNKVAMSPTEILEWIAALVSDILDKNNWAGESLQIRDSLISLFDMHVSYLDSESKKGSVNDLQLSIDNSISYADIISKIEHSDQNVTAEDRVRNISFYLNLNLQERILDETDDVVDISKVERFLDAYNRLPKVKKQNVVRRLFPHFDVEGRQTNIGDLTNQEVANYLYNVLTQTEMMNLDELHWEVSGQLHSPSTLGKSTPSKNYCGKIVKNMASLPPELLRDYRWIVGDITETISDIFESAHAINKISDEDYNNISKSRKIGLLTIHDKNNGNIS